MMEKSDKLCQDIMKLIEFLMPGKIFFHPSNDLAKIIEHILGRATNQPKSCRQYAKLCHDIVYELRRQDSRATFKTTLVSIVQQRFVHVLSGKKDIPMNVRLGIVRFIGELYNFTFITEKIIIGVMRKIYESSPLQLEHCEYLYELIKVIGWKLNETNPEIMIDFKRSLRALGVNKSKFSPEVRDMIFQIYKMEEKDFVNPKDAVAVDSPEKQAIDISKLSLKPKTQNVTSSDSQQRPDIVVAIETFLRDPTAERLDKIMIDIKFLDSDTFVNILHQMGSNIDSKQSNLVAFFCTLIEARGVVPKFQETLLDIIRGNMHKFIKYSTIFNEAECDFSAHKSDESSKLRISKDVMPLVVNTSKGFLSSFMFLGHLYNNDFVSCTEILQYLESLSSMRVVSNLSIECFEAIFSLTAPKLLENKSYMPVVVRYFSEIFKASKLCPKTTKTERLVNSLVSKAHSYLNHNFVEMFAIDDYDFDFPEFESEWEAQYKRDPLF